MIYDLLADVYDKINAELDYSAWADFIEKIIADNYGKRAELILDLAAGTGKMTLELASRGYDMTAVDGSPEMLDAVKAWMKDNTLDSLDGMIEDFDDGTSNYYSRTTNYIEVPFFAHLSWGKEKRGFQFFLNLGPQFGFFLGESEKYHGDWKPEYRPSTIRPLYGKALENSFEYGIAGGLGLEYKSSIGNFFIEGRYFYGLSDIFHNSKADEFGRSANTTITARIGYSFTIFNRNFQ